MNVYVESNFVLELALLQEEAVPCDEILKLCGSGQICVLIPAYCLAETSTTVAKYHRRRRSLKEALDVERQQLTRTTSYSSLRNEFEAIRTLLNKSVDEEAKRLTDAQRLVAQRAEVIPLTAEAFEFATACQENYGLSSQDSVVYASVVSHLKMTEPESALFLTRDNDFMSIEAHEDWGHLGCKLLTSFEHGLGYIRSRLETPDPPEA